jgi:hypothetical protein
MGGFICIAGVGENGSITRMGGVSQASPELWECLVQAKGVRHNVLTLKWSKSKVRKVDKGTRYRIKEPLLFA